jgi:hypothetical protein
MKYKSKPYFLHCFNSSSGSLRGIFVQELVKELSLKLDDNAIVSFKTPEQGPPNEMKTIKTPEKSKKKK